MSCLLSRNDWLGKSFKWNWKIRCVSYYLTPDFITYLPLNFLRYLTALDAEVKILFAKVSDAKRFDKDINLIPSAVNIIDCGQEPILISEHDA